MSINPRIGGPNALSWPAFWVVLATSIAINVPDRYTAWSLGTSWRNVLCNAIAVAAMFAVMLALRGVLLRHADVRPGPWRALAMYSVGAVVRGLMLAALLPTIGVAQAVPLYRVITSVLILVPLLAITTGLIDLIRTSAARRAVLQAEAIDLVAAERDAVARTDGLRQGAIAEVRGLLLQRLEAIRGGAAPSTNLEAELRSDVEQVIRPMSRELFEGEVDLPPVASAPPAAKVSWSDVWRSASLGRPFRPVPLATLLAIGFVNALINYTTPAQGLGYAAAVWVIVYVVFAVLDRLLTDPMRRMRVASRTVTLVVASAAGLAAAGFMARAVLAAGGSDAAWRVPLATMLLGPIVAVALAVEQGFRRQVRSAGAEQEGTNGALRVAAALAASARRHEERRLSRSLHGPIQTAVTAAAMRIEAGDDAGAEALLVQAVGHLEMEVGDVAPVAEALGHVAAVWFGLCAVDTDLDPGVERELDARPTAATAFIDICTEACSNAVRHGGARNVVMGGSRAAGAIELEIRDDGAPTAAEVSSGLGTALLDEVTLGWERYRDGGFTVLRATLPLGA